MLVTVVVKTMGVGEKMGTLHGISSGLVLSFPDSSEYCYQVD